MAIELYSHNQETYEKLTEMFKTSNRVGVVQPTGTGKSFLYLKWIEDHPGESFAILSPSTEIFAQLQEYALASGVPGLLDEVQMISYQALLRMSDEEIQEIRLDKMVLDEFHRTGADLWGPSLMRLLEANPAAQVLGASATPVRYLDESRDMASELFDRNLAVEMTLGEAVQRNILPAPVYVPVWYDLDGTLSQYQRDISRVFSAQKRRELEERLAKLKRRLEDSYGAEDIFRKYMPNDHGKYIVFCRGREHLDEMKEAMRAWLSGVNPNVHEYVSISLQADRDLQMDSFKSDNSEDAIKLLFTIDRLNEGLHVKGIDGVIMLRPTASPIIYLQQMGRALSVGHDKPLIFDMVNNYQNVQIPLSDGGSVNVFEREFRDAMEASGDMSSFRIFEDMVSFTNLFSEVEALLYLTNDEKWEAHYANLVDFVAENDRFPYSYETYKDFHIGRWCLQQRTPRVRSTLSEYRLQKLDEIGLFGYTRFFSWDENYKLLVEFKEKFDRFPIFKEIYKGMNLGRWYHKQKMALIDQMLTGERAEKLLALGVAETTLDAIWNQKYQILVQFVNNHNRFPKPSDRVDEFNIGKWYCKQRHLARNNLMLEDRLRKLQEIGFSYDRVQMSWDEYFALLSDFVNDFGRFPKVTDRYRGYNLGNWFSKQKQKIKKKKLDEQKVDKLKTLGFCFD